MKTFKKFVSVMMALLIVLALSSCDLIQDAEITPAIPDGVESGDIRIGILFADDYEKDKKSGKKASFKGVLRKKRGNGKSFAYPRRACR